MIILEIKKTCQLCNKEFITDTLHNDNICNNMHIFKCLNCNKDVLISKNQSDWYKRNLYLTKNQVFCSNKCSIQYNHYIKFMIKYKSIAEQIKEKYETTIITKKEIMEQYKLSLTTTNLIFERFNIQKPDDLKFELYSNKSKKQYNKLTLEQKEKQRILLSEKGTNYWKNITENEIEIRINKSKETWKNKSEDEKKKIVNKILETKRNKPFSEKKLHKERLSKSITEWWNSKTAEEKHNISLKAINTNQKQGSKRWRSKDGLNFHSSYELDVYEFCKRNNLQVETQIPIKYTYNNKEHITFIDFKIDNILFECKGNHLLNGIFDDKQEVPIEQKLKIYTQNKVILIIDERGKKLIPPKNSNLSNGLKYLNKCPNPLIAVDINLFKNPKFPFAKNKPDCFYKVRVNKQPSVYDVWNNEELRWKMIKNRIDYVGGFIDAKEILNAMNITRTCKQPSWFSKSYAKKLIQKYITTDKIYDSFAGWGARCDACLELKIDYIGCDFNKELIDWHKKCNRNIIYEDANNFKYNDNNCSVFICPPYQDYETYFDGQDLKTTQIEWLKIVMQNIPNAKEYLMVFKIIDKPEYKQFVVEEKINKSHFGINKEYVILVKQLDKEKFLNI